MRTELKIAPVHRQKANHHGARRNALRSARSLALLVFFAGGLGMALGWFYGEANRLLSGQGPSASLLEAAFGIWFLTYSSIWLSQSWRFDGEAPKAGHRDYTWWIAASDLTDGSVMFIAFQRLNADPGIVTANEIVGYWFGVLTIALSAFLSNADIVNDPRYPDQSPRLFFLSMAGWALASIAIALNWSTIQFNPALFAVLTAMTATYAFWVFTQADESPA